MPILTTCRHCGASFNLADTMLGKRVRCRQCEKIFTVEEEDAEDDIPKAREVKRPNQGIRSDARRPAQTLDVPSRPKRGRDRDDDDRSDENSGSSNATLLIILGVGAALFLLVGGVVTYLLVRVTSAPPVAVANPPQVVPNQPANPNPNPTPNPNLNPNPNPDPNPILPPPPAPPAWQVAVDGPAQARQALARPQEVIPALNSANVLFAQGHGPFVAVGSNITNRDGRDIWNLETMQKVGTLNGQIQSMDPTLLSPDGNYLLTRTVNQATTFEIYSTANGQRVALVNVDPKIAVLPYVDFAGNDQMVTVKNSIRDKLVQVWDLKTGMLRKQIDARAVSFDPKAYAVSPGGRYLAMVNEAKLSVFDLREGGVAGTTQVPAPRGTLIFSPTSLAFSPDGVELAALFDNPEKVVVWDVVSGKVLKDNLLPSNLRTLVSKTNTYIGPTLDWLPDRSGWLYRGFILLDAVSGKPVYTLPTNLERGFPGPRRMLTANQIAMTTGHGTSRKVQIVELPKDVIDQAVKEARSGQTPGAAPDQKTIAADWATVRQLAPVNGVPPWNFEPDPLPSNKLVNQPIPIKPKGSDIHSLWFANKSAQAAVLSLVAPTDPLRPRQLHVDRYDLSNGQALGGLDLQGVTKQGFIELVGDLSPEGDSLAVVDPQEEKRVDIWSLATGKPQVSFLPLGAGEDSKVRFVAFLPDKRFLTITKAGKLTVWSIPDCKAIYSGDGYQGAQALSPGRKYLAASRDSGIVMLETATGEIRGQLTLSAGSVPANTFALAFNPESTTLVGVISKASNGVNLARWQLGKQNATGSFYGLPYPSRSLQCCGDQHVLVENQLFDLNLQASVGIYSLPGMGRGGFGGPDGRFWFAVAGQNQTSAVLAAQTLPDAQTRQYLMALSQPGTKKVLGPGAAITVQVQLLGAAPKAQDLRGQVFQGLSQRLRSLSFTPEEGQALTLKVQFQEKATGKTAEYKELLGGRNGKIIIQIKQVECQAVLTGPDGVLWQAKNTVQTPDRNVLQGNDFQGMLDQQMWSQATGWASSLTIPSMLVKVGNKLEGLPHSFVLTGDQ